MITDKTKVNKSVLSSRSVLLSSLLFILAMSLSTCSITSETSSVYDSPVGPPRTLSVSDAEHEVHPLDPTQPLTPVPRSKKPEDKFSFTFRINHKIH